MTKLKRIDASIGDPCRAFKEAAQYAMDKVMTTLNQYDNYGDVAHYMPTQIMDFFDREFDIKQPGWSGVGLQSYAYTNGITDGYDSLLAIRLAHAKTFNKTTGTNLKPAIIMPVPTYGIFFAQPEQMGIDIIKLQREPDGSVCPEKLLELMRSIEKKGEQQLIAYYDSNPNNPTGYVRGQEDTEKLAAVFVRYNEYKSRQKKELLLTLNRDQFRALRDTPTTLLAIDDMVYLGLEYTDKKPMPFLNVSEMYDNTVMLAGGSKIGLTGLRTGVMIGSEKYVEAYKKEKKLKQYFPSTLNMHALTPVFPSEDAHIKMRKKHLKALNTKHQFSGLLMKAIVNGLDDVEITTAQREKMISLYSNIKKISTVDAEERLSKGIHGINITTTPQSGFFHLVDYSAFKGMPFIEQKRYYEPIIGTLKDEWDLQTMHREAQLGFCAGEHCGYTRDDMIVRTTFAMTTREVIALTSRMEYAIDEHIRPLQHTYPEKPKTLAV
jgi:aspartate/methionine/tyrosine aminotransferase|tara:strand:- start:503981 stop:505456 length:1476 start_codon:yes stop_codon:yes gene_type:complete